MMQPDDPPFLTVGTEVSAKYKGAFCEAKVHKVVKIVKIKVTFKQGLGSAVLSDEAIKGVLKVGAQVKALHSERGHVDAIINKIQDCSQYTVVFDDGDITTLRRTSLCLKSGRHFAESETLDQLPLTHPEHFGTPVVGGRRGRRLRQNLDSDASSEDEENVYKKHRSHREEWESDIGKLVCVEIGDKKRVKDNWFPGLVVAPTAQDSVKIESKKDYLVRSFQDGRYYTVPKKEASKFNREVSQKVTQSALRTAVDKALLYIDRDELPPHWDRDLLFGIISDEDLEKDSESESSDDEPREEKDHFVAQLYKYMEECGTPINKGPIIGSRDLDLYKLFKVVQKLGGFNRVMNQNQWKVVASKMNLQFLGSQSGTLAKAAYKRYLQSFEDFYRKLGCTMVSSPRGSRMRHRSGRSLIRDCDRTPRPKKDTESCDSAEEYGDKTDELEDTKSESGKEDVQLNISDTLKKEEMRISRKRTPPVRSASPINKERLREVRSKMESRVRIIRKEEVRTRSSTAATALLKGEYEEDSRSLSEEEEEEEEEEEKEEEEETEVISTRTLRNREDHKDKEESFCGKITTTTTTTTTSSTTSTTSTTTTTTTKRQRTVQEQHQRSTSCNSTSSGTSSSSCLSSSSSVSSSSASSSSSIGDGKMSDKCKKHALLIEEKKKGRKKRLDSETDLPCGKPLLPVHVPVNIGDKLLVLYGPNNKESKVTYEAKVLEIDEESSQKIYYVHYLGWNTRYDEWVIRQRIAQNLTWCQARARKGRAAATKELQVKERKSIDEKGEKQDKDSELTSATPTRIGKRSSRTSTPSEKRDGERSSSVTRSNSRNEMREEKEGGLSFDRRRSRRKLGVSKDPEDGYSEDFDSGAESNSEQMSGKASLSHHSSLSSTPKTLTPEPTLGPLNHEMLKDSIKQSEGKQDTKSIKNDDIGLNISSIISSISCGKDIDLKAIESEMKGLDRPIKKEDGLNIKESDGRLLTTVIPGSLTIIEKKVHDPKKPFDSPVKKLEIPVKLVPALEVMGQIKPVPISGLKKEKSPFQEDDIYEFKEPEPFDIGEIRTRKDGRPMRGQDEIEIETKSKKTSKNWDEKTGNEETKECPETPKKRAPKEIKESPVKRSTEFWDAAMKTESKRDVKDYTRKSEVPADDKKRETPRKGDSKKLAIHEISDIKSESPEPLPFIELIHEGKVPLSGQKENLDLEAKESILFGASVILSPKKPTSRKELNDSVIDKGEPVVVKPSPNESSSPKANVCTVSSTSKEDTKPNSTPIKSPHGVIERSLPAKVPPKVPVQSGHILPQMILPPMESRILAKAIPKIATDKMDKGLIAGSASPSKAEERPDGKMMSFSQRQQHIFPHLLNRSEHSEEKGRTEIPIVKSIPSTSSAPSVAAIVQPPIETASTSKIVETDKFKCESSVEESIEAVVLRARQDQMDAAPEKIDLKTLEKRRRNPIRSKKILSREFLHASSEDSDSDSKSDKTEHNRQKRSKSDGVVKYSPLKRMSRLSSGSEKKISQRCDDEDRANDADEEDNEVGSAPIRNLCREAIKKRRDLESNREEEDSEGRRTPIKKRRSSATVRRSDDSEETGLGDLLCEETIPPGSPMPQEIHEAEAPVAPVSLKQEMPFASVPTGSNFNKRVPVTTQGPLSAPPLHLPPSICIQPVPQGRTHQFENIVPPQVSPPTVTITSIPVVMKHNPSTSEKPAALNQEKSPCVPTRSPVVPDKDTKGAPSLDMSGTSGVKSPNASMTSDKSAIHTLVKASFPEAGASSPTGGEKSKVEVRPAIPPPPPQIPSIDQTPPTTPESILSNSSDSPRRDVEAQKSYETNKSGPSYSSEDSNTMDSISSTNKSHKKKSGPSGALGGGGTHSHSDGWDSEDGSAALAPSKRRKKSSKVRADEDEDESTKTPSSAGPCAPRRRRRHSSRGSGKCDEEIDNHGLNALSLVACASGRSRFNFCQEIDADLDPAQRIVVLQGRMQKLKRTYMQVKAELASVERRRKKLKKKEKENE